MSVTRVFRCDVCGIQKGPNNHWFLLLPSTEKLFRLIPWDVTWENDTTVRHSCGEQCSSKLLSTTIASWSKQ